MPSEPNPISKRQGAFLPHWRQDEATYAVTFRTADSLPKVAIDRLALERHQLLFELETAGALENAEELSRLEHLMSEKIEALLNNRYGECVLKNPAVATLVIGAMKHFDGIRYTLHAAVVMPNHVHAALRPFNGESLELILKSWKSFTARRINAILRRRGTFWQAESYDHLIRGAQDFDHALNYIVDNPVKAGLVDWPWVYLSSSLRASL